MPLITALRRQRQEDLCEFEASLIYRVSSRTGSRATEEPCLEKIKKNKKIIFACVCVCLLTIAHMWR